MATSSAYMTIPGLIAGADLSAAQYKCVKLASTANEVVLAVLPADKSIGILLNDPADGEEALVAYSGVIKALAEASVTIGALVAASTTSRVKVTTTANDGIVGRAITASSTAGDMVSVMVHPSNY